MTRFRYTFLSLVSIAMAACSSSPTESTLEKMNKIPPTFKGTWRLERISCANGALGTTGDFINANLNNNNSGNKLGLLINHVQEQDVTSTVSSGLGGNAATCSYAVTQNWEKTGHWLQVSAPATVKTGDITAEVCEAKKSDFTTSPTFKYLLPIGEISIESKNGMMYLYRTLGRSEKDLEICQTSDRFIYELKRQGD